MYGGKKAMTEHSPYTRKSQLRALRRENDQLKSENAKLKARMKNTEDILLNEEANPLISDAIKTLRGEA